MRHNNRPASELSDDPRLEGYLTLHGKDPYEQANGPYYWKVDPDGTIKCAFIAQRKALNGDNMLHGGSLMGFADFAIFRFSEPYRDNAVTLNFDCDFTAPAFEGDFIECTGDIIRNTGGFIFLRGDVFAMRDGERDGERKGERVVILSFKATIKKVRS